MSFICYNITTNGSYMFHEDTWHYLIQIFPLQASMIVALNALSQFLLKPFGINSFGAQLATNVSLGKYGFSRIDQFLNLFALTKGGTHLAAVLGSFGCMIYIFLIGLKLDISTIKRTSKSERVIGILTFILPMLFTVPLSFLIEQIPPNFFDHKYGTDSIDLKDIRLPWVAALVSTTSFHVISCFLTDLKILNTVLGRMSSSASMISGMCSLITVVISWATKDNEKSQTQQWTYYWSSIFAQVLFITMVLRNIVLWMIRQTPQGKPINDTYIFSIYLMILGTGIIGEICGQHYYFGPMILGLAIPNGPPLASTLSAKLDTFVSGFFMPLYFFYICYNSKLSDVPVYFWWTIIPLALLGFLGKIVGTLIACHFYQIPFRDALMIGMNLSTIGLIDIVNYKTTLVRQENNLHIHGVLIICSMVVAGFTSMVVYFFFDPSRRYTVYKNRTIQNAKHDAELHILVCTYSDENVPTLVNILQASNPTKESPIIVYLLHLVELTGRSNPLVINHKSNENQFNGRSPSDRIVNCFKIFEKKNKGTTYLHAFTSFTLILSAQDDICTLALDKRTSFIIIPFHRQYNIDGTIRTCKWRSVNIKVLKQASCSVGILIDRGILNGSKSAISNWSIYNIAVIFLGDADDRESICYAIRMSKNPNVHLTVYRFINISDMIKNVTESLLDDNIINEYRINNNDSKKNFYEEKEVKDGVGVISTIQSMDTSYDLILVGRRHNSHSRLFSGLVEWNDIPELGFLGDLLASSDFKGKASTLVVQQHSCLQRGISLDEKSTSCKLLDDNDSD